MSFFFGRKTTAAPSPEPVTRFTNAGQDASNRSLELVRFNQDTGKFEVGSEALEVLRRTRGPVGVVAVAGRARQGKSYILNQLLGRSGGFTVAPTHRPFTKGLWLWSQPIEQAAPDGSKYHLVLLDTEGIDAYDQTGQYSTQIFSLAVLLSSLFVYNQMGGIDEAALDKLSLVTEMTSHIRVRASDGQASDPSELSAFTPSFIWLLRDFYLRLEEDGRTVTPKEYLETALKSLPGNSDSIRAKNAIRESIKSLFPDRDCFTLVRPVNNEEELGRLDTLSTSQLRPEFRDGLSRLARLIFSKATAKRLGSQVLTGPMLAGLTEAYTTAINGGAVPTIATAWQGVAEGECRRAADAAETVYMNTLISSMSSSSSSADVMAMEAAHQSALLAAQREFDTMAMGDDAIRKANERRWRETCAARFKEHKEKALAIAEAACERAINNGATRIRTLLSKDSATIEEIQREMAVFQREYSNSNEISGPTKWKRLAEFTIDVYGNAVVEVMQRRVRAAQHAAETATQRIAAIEGSATMLQERATRAENQLTRAQEEMKSMQQGVQEKERELAAVRHEMHALQHAERQAQAERAGDRDRVGGLVAELEGARHQLQEYQNEKSVWEGEKARLNATIASVTAARDEYGRKVVDAERDVVGLRTEIERLKGELLAAMATNNNGAATDRRRESGGDGVIVNDADMVGGDGEAEEVPVQAATATAAPTMTAPDTKKMTIAAMKTWLTDNGHEGAAWELAQKKAKKAEYESFIKNLFP